MKIAYLILTHRFPDQLFRLIDRLPPDAPVFIHFDKRADDGDYARIAQMAAQRPNVALVARHHCVWGGYGIVAGTVELVKALVASGRPFDYAVLLSGADYPLASNAQIAAHLTAQQGAEHIESFPLAMPNRWSNDTGPLSAQNRYRNYYLWFRSRNLRIPVSRKPPLGLPLHGGTQWWALTADCIRYCATFFAENPGFLRFFRHTAIPDEAVFQTVIANSPFRDRITGREIVLTIWDRPTPPYPAVLNEADWDELMASGHLFARKFDPVASAALMDRLDASHAEAPVA
jgi:hypothetical protein